MESSQLRSLIVGTLQNVGLYSPEAVELLMLTAAVESKLGHYIKQIKGPAQGIFQMEPATERDIWKNFIAYKQDLYHKITPHYTATSGELVWNLRYAILMARVHYLRVQEPLPAADDLMGLAKYWKDHYNTHKGKGTVEKAIKAYTKLVA